MGDLLEQINDFAIDLGGSEWVFVVVLAFAAIDAFFPPIPSESVVVALAAIGASTGEPNLVLLAVSAGLGAFVGDNIAFRIGRVVGVERFDTERRPRLRRAVDRAGYELDPRAALLILTARYVPVGRVAVNMTAGATDFPYRRFLPLCILGAASWSAYSVLIGVVAGTWVKEHPLLGAAVAVVLAAGVGFVIDQLLQRKRRRDLAEDPDPEPDPA
ncbi:MAG: DedA family protein [Aeromicrobium sp.]|uniref:DedA family protein n=1 Tax=Aeromicrobium sp. TaxID=1871063 RepID=UPI002606C58F|nr:DedA family protein [Aeromicrobium sp.]MDF1704642.1 DedA family protein [Aeromicrobium sp.]